MVLGLVALLLSPIVPPAVAGSSPAVSLTLTPPAVTFGRSQTPSGTIMADVPCAAGRTVDLQQEAAGTSVWTAVGSPATSDGSGGFTFGARQPTANASYRAVVEPVVVGATTCDQLTSPARPGKVRAAVTFALGRVVHDGDGHGEAGQERDARPAAGTRVVGVADGPNADAGRVVPGRDAALRDVA